MAALPILLLLTASFGAVPGTGRSIPLQYAQEKRLAWGNDDIPGSTDAPLFGQQNGPSRLVTTEPSEDELDDTRPALQSRSDSRLQAIERRSPGRGRGGYGAPYSQRTNVASGPSRRPGPAAPGPRPGYSGAARRPEKAGLAPCPGYAPPPPSAGPGAPGPRPGYAVPAPRPGYAPPARGRPEPAVSAQKGSDTVVKGAETAVKGPEIAAKGPETAAKGQSSASVPAADAPPPRRPGSVVVNLPSDTSLFGKVERGANFAANSAVLTNTLARGGIDTAHAFKNREPTLPANAPQPGTSAGATFDVSTGWWHHKSVGYFKPKDMMTPGAKFHDDVGYYTTPEDIQSPPENIQSTPQYLQSTPHDMQPTPQDSDEAATPVPRPEDQQNQPSAFPVEENQGKNQTDLAR